MPELMENLGPFEAKESKWLLFSIGNPYERHGFALSKNIDDLHAKHAAYELELHTGQHYVAHIPYTTDRCGDVAKDWAPYYISWDELYRKSVDFMRYFIEIIRKRGENIERVMLISGHGGNGNLLERKCQKEIQKELDIKKFVAITAHVSRKNAVRVLEEVKILANETIERKKNKFGFDNPEDLTEFYTKLLLSAGHASHAEHSLGAALGVCDMKKVEIMNALLEKDFEQALKRWPAIGGLGGYLLAGGKYTEALGTEDDDKYGLWNCLNGLRNLHNGKLVVIPELGALVHRISLETKTQIINKFL